MLDRLLRRCNLGTIFCTERLRLRHHDQREPDGSVRHHDAAILALKTFQSEPYAGRVKLSIHDVTGRLIETLVDGAEAKGPHTAHRSAARSRGSGILPSGVYFIRLEALGGTSARRVVVMR
jgi:hypothetical protein